MLRAAYNIFFLTTMITACAQAQSNDYSDSELAANFTVNGLRVSANSEIAIINDKLTRVGEKIGEATLVAIESDLVHLQVADRTFAMRVGSSVIRESQYSVEPDPTEFEIPDAIEVTLPPRLANRETLPPSQSATPPIEMIGDVFKETYGPIASGETLSEIAESFATHVGEREQIMAALYDENPQAFGGSMDLLYAGVHLIVPTISVTVAERAPAAADPLLPTARPQRPARDLPAQVHVQPADTLSAIAAGYLRDDITLNQLMLVIYAANRAGFGDNINVLYAYETLTIPDLSTVSLAPPAAAQATVSEHMARWREPFRSVQIKHNTAEPERRERHAAAAAN